MPLTTWRPRPRRRAAAHSATPAALFLALLGTALCALLTVVVTAGPAAAHAVQTDSTPAEGRVVSSAPEKVTVTFSEGVSMSDGSIRVLGPDGKRLDTNKVSEVPGKANTRAVDLKPDGPKGTYTVAWKAVSDDSHPVSGAFTFSVGHPSQTSANVSDESQGTGGGPAGALYQVGRYAAYTGFILLVGGAAFVLVCRPERAAVRRLQRLVVTGWLTLTGATLLMLLLRNAYTGTGQLSEVFDLGGLKDALGSKSGASLAARLLLLGTAAVIISVLFGSYGSGSDGRASEEHPEEQHEEQHEGQHEGEGEGEREAPSEKRREEERGAREKEDRGRDVTLGLTLGGGVVAVGLATTWAVAEHASTGPQAQVAMPVDVVHLLAVATWLGGLASLLTVLHRGPSPGRAVVRRFSQVAFGSVVVLAVTGLYQSWRQLGTFTALTGTSFGRLLLTKVGLVVLLVGLAYVSRQWTSRLGEVRAGTGKDTAAESAEAEASGAEAAGEAAVRVEAPATVGAAARSTAPGTAPGTGAHEEAGADGGEPGSGAGSAGAAEAAGSGDAAAEPAGTAATPAATASTDRAAQLARQRAAVARERRRKEREADPERAGLRRSVLAEAAVAVVLLVVTTALTDTQPGRTEELTKSGGTPGAATGQVREGLNLKQKIPFDTGGPNGKGTAVLWITPGQAGGNALRIMTKDPDGKQLRTEEVKAALTLPEQDLGPFQVEFERINDAKGRWRSEIVQLPVAGRWKASVTIRTSDIDQVTESKTVQLD
ncbi:copper resistance CopC/CopD family protein [Streptomyces sp. WMMB 322]|uniref:copper resistance CopC/CopD family protein n=1 Tax=Streptomyces sp. WMMB 322 TaxID=1286821 RepID=UPI000823F123|nr:copper resistance protein CopC [Streptomyces sp. WMMB 322]SCK14071.1 copper transport protein [Streptomyces sp. WMMB 322]